MKSLRIAFTLTLLLVIESTAAQADPIIVWNLSGHITSENLVAFPDLPVGTAIEFVVAVDLATPDTCPSPSSGQYFFPDTEITYGGVTYGGSAHLEVNSAAGSCTPFNDLTLRVIRDGPAGFFANFPSGTTPGNQDIPIYPPWGGFFIGGGLFSSGVNGILDQVVVTPEPTSLTLLGLGVGGMLLRQRRRKKTREPFSEIV